MCMDTSRAAPHAISQEVARRYLLGRQGLWPGRRWAGKDGAAEAVRQLEAVQVDPMTVVARSHDLVLWSRVAGYDPEHLDTLLYRDRAFFDYGGCVHIYPVHELPYWRLHMERRRADKRRAAFLAEHAALLDEVREEVRARGPLGNRDFAGHARVSSYRARKDTGLALYHLWLTGELMTHSREGFQRKFDLRERVAPSSVGHVVPAEEAERFFARKALALLGLHTARAWAGTFAFLLNRRIDRAEARRWLEGLVAAGEAASVLVEGQKDLYYYPAADAPLLAKLADGDAPVEWRPLDTATREEVILLSPLDNLLARQRTRLLFGFEYLWEVYKPAANRRWGYYTMPILWRDRLVARLDPKLDRRTGTLVVNGFWLEEGTTAEDPAFAAALAHGLGRFAHFLAARQVDLAALHPEPLREHVGAAIAL